MFYRSYRHIPGKKLIAFLVSFILQNIHQTIKRNRLRNFFLVITGQEFPLALLALHATAKLVARIRPLPPAIPVPSTVTDPPLRLSWSANPPSRVSPVLETERWPL